MATASTAAAVPELRPISPEAVVGLMHERAILIGHRNHIKKHRKEKAVLARAHARARAIAHKLEQALVGYHKLAQGPLGTTASPRNQVRMKVARLTQDVSYQLIANEFAPWRAVAPPDMSAASGRITASLQAHAVRQGHALHF